MESAPEFECFWLVLFVCIDILKNNIFEGTTRLEAASLEYPKVLHSNKQRLLKKLPYAPTEVSSMVNMTSRSTCEQMKDLCLKGKYQAVSCELGTFTVRSLDELIKIHDLRDQKSAVISEQQWLAKQIIVPNAACSYSKEHVKAFENKIFDSPSGHCVLDNNSYILASDLATLSGNGWVHFSIMMGIADILHRQSSQTGALMLNNVLLMNNDNLNDYIDNYISPSIKYLILFANVGKNSNGELFFSDPMQKGNHWTMIYIDLTVNKWFYCDPASWNMPADTKGLLSPIVKAVYKKSDIRPKSFKGITQAHVHSRETDNKCSKNASEICHYKRVLIYVELLWKDAFLNRHGILPSGLNWLMSPSRHSDFLRHTVISWLLTDSISLSVMGIVPEKIPPPSAFPIASSTRTNSEAPEVVIIPDDDAAAEDAVGTKEMTHNLPQAQDTRDETQYKWQTVKRKGMRKRYQKLGQAVNRKRKEPSDAADRVSKRELKKKKQEAIKGTFNEHPLYDVETPEADEQKGTLEADGQEETLETDGQEETLETDEQEETLETDEQEGGLNMDDDIGKDEYSIGNDNGEVAFIEAAGIEETENQAGSEIAFFEGQKFSSYDELYIFKKRYEESHFIELYNRDVRTLEAASKRVPKRVALAKRDLRYYSLKLSCKFGGKTLQERKERRRNTKTFKQGCPFEIYFLLTLDGQHLEAIKIKKEHNHDIKREIHDHLLRQRASHNESAVKEIEEALKLQANPKLLKKRIEDNTGQKITLKDLANLKFNLKREINRNNLEDVIRFLKTEPGALAEVVVDDDNNFKGLFYADAYMQNMFKYFPELLLVDATYKLLDLRMPIYLLMCIDGNGLSEIVGVFILAEETKEVIEASVETFKRYNSSWDKTKVIMSDKDFVERDVFTKCFPGATLNICLFHTLRSFKREITCEKMGITSAERLRALEILTSLAHSKSAADYDRNLNVLTNSNIKSVIDYVLENWHPIKEQWVTYFKDNNFNLGETTNNRLESTFSKIKSVCSKYASLMQFFSEFLTVMRCLREERNHQYLMAITRKKTELQALAKDLQSYAEHLTPYAFGFLREQFDLVHKVTVVSQTSSKEFTLSSSKNSNLQLHQCTPTLCDCPFFTRMHLPCKHIFKVRTLLNLPIFDPCMSHKRWTMEFYKETDRFNSAISENPVKDSVEIPNFAVNAMTKKENTCRTLSQAQKFRKALQSAQVLASLASEGGMATFKRRQSVLESIIKSWQLCHEVVVFDAEEIKDKENDVATDQENSEFESAGLEPTSDNQPPVSTDKEKEKLEDRKETETSASTNYPLDAADPNDTSQLKNIKLPPKILKRGRPKGGGVTVIGLPRIKKQKEKWHKLLPFSKFPPDEKNRLILTFITSERAAGEALVGKRLLNSQDVLPLHELSDALKDAENVDIQRVRKFFDNDAWLRILELKEKINKIGWLCAVCKAMIDDEMEDSIACDRCLLWTHFQCTTLKKRPKNRIWFCKSCKKKFL